MKFKSLAILAMSMALCAACAADHDSTSEPPVAAPTDVEISPAAMLNADPGLLTSEPKQLVETIMTCFAAGRDRWMSGALPEPVLAEMWGDLSWIRSVTKPELREQYETVFDLSAGQHTVSAQKLLAATNQIADGLAHARARQIEGWMNEQYGADVPENSDEFDADFRAALEASSKQLQAVGPFVAKMSPTTRPYARLLLEGAIYKDDFAQSCASAQILKSPAADQELVKQAMAAVTQGADTP